ncbi:Intersectin-1 [Smittium mucronatum]|uniref:Intersectin-1 n=1 Tax=Smittium mucronatum TaxID=133383 RepID=A0A1R0GSZ5_9FUNG|nr:Intersectin-1 [Smittium mucronatum]
MTATDSNVYIIEPTNFEFNFTSEYQSHSPQIILKSSDSSESRNGGNISQNIEHDSDASTEAEDSPPQITPAKSRRKSWQRGKTLVNKDSDSKKVTSAHTDSFTLSHKSIDPISIHEFRKKSNSLPHFPVQNHIPRFRILSSVQETDPIDLFSKKKKLLSIQENGVDLNDFSSSQPIKLRDDLLLYQILYKPNHAECDLFINSSEKFSSLNNLTVAKDHSDQNNFQFDSSKAVLDIPEIKGETNKKRVEVQSELDKYVNVISLNQNSNIKEGKDQVKNDKARTNINKNNLKIITQENLRNIGTSYESQICTQFPNQPIDLSFLSGSKTIPSGQNSSRPSKSKYKYRKSSSTKSASPQLNVTIPNKPSQSLNDIKAVSSGGSFIPSTDLIPSQISKNRTKRYYIIKEICCSESLYVKDLELIDSCVLKPLISQKILPLYEAKIISRNISKILLVHSRVLDYFQPDNNLDDIIVGLSNLTSNLSEYIEYFVGQNSAIELISHLSCNKSFSSFLLKSLSKFNQSSGNRRLEIQDLLIKPIQRVLKYPLFISELLSTLDNSSSSHQKLSKIKKKIVSICSRINDAQKSAHMSELTIRFIQSYRGNPFLPKSVICKLGVVQLSGSLDVIDHPNLEKSRKFQKTFGCVLFNRFFIVNNVESDQNSVLLEPKYWFPLHSIELIVVNPSHSNLTWRLTHTRSGQYMDFSANSKQENKIWINNMTYCISESKTRASRLKLKTDDSDRLTKSSSFAAVNSHVEPVDLIKSASEPNNIHEASLNPNSSPQKSPKQESKRNAPVVLGLANNSDSFVIDGKDVSKLNRANSLGSRGSGATINASNKTLVESLFYPYTSDEITKCRLSSKLYRKESFLHIGSFMSSDFNNLLKFKNENKRAIKSQSIQNSSPPNFNIDSLVSPVETKKKKFSLSRPKFFISDASESFQENNDQLNHSDHESPISPNNYLASASESAIKIINRNIKSRSDSKLSNISETPPPPVSSPKKNGIKLFRTSEISDVPDKSPKPATKTPRFIRKKSHSFINPGPIFEIKDSSPTPPPESDPIPPKRTVNRSKSANLSSSGKRNICKSSSVSVKSLSTNQSFFADAQREWKAKSSKLLNVLEKLSLSKK